MRRVVFEPRGCSTPPLERVARWRGTSVSGAFIPVSNPANIHPSLPGACYRDGRHKESAFASVAPHIAAKRQ